jgi:hypothetical protein
MHIGQIYAAHPSYNGGHPASHESFWKLLTSPRKMILAKNGGSLLCGAFNQSWAHALDLQLTYEHGRKAFRDGAPYLNNPHKNNDDDYQRQWNFGYKDQQEGHEKNRLTHFIMLHDDISPYGLWIEDLITEMQRFDADVVSAVVPIKDTRGITSTAIDNPDNCFAPERRLTMTEIENLPMTFTSADCGYPDRALLVNSGCFLARFDKPWRLPPFRFNIDDRISYATEGRYKDHYVAETASEDWQFSRHVHKHGGKVMATKRVKLDHWGMMSFPNFVKWGQWTTDQLYEEKQPDSVDKNNCDRQHIPSDVYPDVKGWLTDMEGALLAGCAANKRVLEIGSYCGLSTIWMAQSAISIDAVDTFNCTGVPGKDEHSTLPDFISNVDKYCQRCPVIYHVGKSTDMVPKLQEKFDIVFIDASHDKESVTADCNLALSKLAPDGFMILHDYCSTDDPGVTEAVDELVAENRVRILEQCGKLVLLKPIQFSNTLVEV